MTHPDEMVRLEREGWDALSTPRGADFYQDVLAPDATMLFPGIGLLDRDAILDAMRQAPPWQSYEMTEVRAAPVAPDAILVTYRVAAQRAGQPPYDALISSLYVDHGGSWRLAFHQHTPDPPSGEAA